jgi:hypothetical protein
MWTGISPSMTSNMLYYFYLRHPKNGEHSNVTGVINPIMNQPITLQLSDTQNAQSGSQVYLNCYNINGTIEANGIWTGLVVSSTEITLIGSHFANTFSTSPDSECKVLQLVASPIGHITSAQGVEILGGSSPDGHYTLVGMCYIGVGQSVQDNPTHRDCASWYNRGTKTCINKFTADHTITGTAYTEVNSEIECEFVTWGTGDPTSQSDLSWSISGMMSNSIGTDGVAATAGFDSATPETEETAAVNPLTAVGGFPLAVTGSKTGLSESKHFITVLGKTITGGTAKFFGSTPDTSLEIRIPQ